MNLETKITIYKFTPQLFTLTLKVPYTKAIRKNENRHFLFYQSKKKDLNHVLAFM